MKLNKMDLETMELWAKHWLPTDILSIKRKYSEIQGVYPD